MEHEAARVARALGRMARDRRTAPTHSVIARHGRLFGRFGTIRVFDFWFSAPPSATKRTIERRHNYFSLLITARARQISISQRAIARSHALTSAHCGKIFCTDEKFLQKRVAQFQHLRTTNHQVTSVFTHFNLQLVNTRTFESCNARCELPELPRNGSKFPWVGVTTKWCVGHANHPYLFMEE